MRPLFKRTSKPQRDNRLVGAQMSRKRSAGTAAGDPKKRKVREAEEDFDWDALLGEEVGGGVDLDEMGRVMVSNSKIR
jgi:hypothetical protein